MCIEFLCMPGSDLWRQRFKQQQNIKQAWVTSNGLEEEEIIENNFKCRVHQLCVNIEIRGEFWGKDWQCGPECSVFKYLETFWGGIKGKEVHSWWGKSVGDFYTGAWWNPRWDSLEQVQSGKQSLRLSMTLKDSDWCYRKINLKTEPPHPSKIKKIITGAINGKLWLCVWCHEGQNQQYSVNSGKFCWWFKTRNKG